MENYLTGRQQRVILNGQTSSWRNILAGIPKGSVLGPLLFLFILMIYLMKYNQYVKYLQMIHRFFQKLKTQLFLIFNSITIWIKYPFGVFSLHWCLNTINPLCTCSLEAETTNHFILHCPYYENERHIPLASIRVSKAAFWIKMIIT